MPPKKQDNADGGEGSELAFTESETKLIYHIFKHSPPSSKVAPNWEAVRQDLGSASIEATKKRFQQISQKRGWFQAEETGEATSNAKKTPARSSSKKKRAANGGDSDAADEQTPTKKPKTAPRKTAQKDRGDEPQEDQQDGGLGVSLAADAEMTGDT
ncbi:hypothetical protein JX265_006472 [Neoarthrinium moseri]|uniref:Myb-like domain-containing protein n=1 Tax=Neoarthrinium moseri TaxID=1658444 RepID=A0A9P9WL69_9PEZI|nr:uncharacterized protein JN550_003155 [Neoarthrinium moseri]KAI1855386.1 hypothetical protein JX266_000251 [Neoarthrinium moseri]KAI1869382.1 hypothetical protein JX265_006472 [Neoarthrinium moseri]KAI1873886.1 hypothetical protein JN550_003155 [Neoarthrinium moseri]